MKTMMDTGAARHTGLLILIAGAILSLTACVKTTKQKREASQADSLVTAAYKARDYQKLISIADEHEAEGTMSKMKAYYWRGYAYSRMNHRRQAEREWKKAVELEVADDDDLRYYAMSANRLASQLLLGLDYEATMRLTVPALAVMEEHQYDMNTEYAGLQNAVATCQLKLGQAKDAAVNYERAYGKYLQIIERDSSLTNFTCAIIGLITTTDNYLLSGYYQEALGWTQHFETLLDRYRMQPQADSMFLDKQWARLNLYRATALVGLGQDKEAAKAYDEARSTRYAKTDDGRIEAVSYLVRAGRWDEAADNLAVLDAQMQLHNVRMTLDNIQIYMLPKYRANFMAQRTDSALAVGAKLCNALDSAIIWQKHDDAAELATIYDTQKKETQIAQQQADISRQRFFTSIVIFILFVVFFTVYMAVRRRAANRLQAAYNQLAQSNAQLKVANERAEESSKMKTNFIQQISHEIRTPLNILSGFTQIITTPGMELDDATRDDINRQITENTNRITGLVGKMLELSDAGSQAGIERTDTVPAVQIAAEAADQSGVTAAPHVTFDMTLTPEAETLMLVTHQASATRALTLLLDNARKFTRPAEATGEVITDEKQTVRLALATADGMAVFAVEDTGIGVPPEEADHIFDEFVQLNDYYDGTGIGLTVARSLARRLGGDVVIDTAYAPGARFVLTLPLAAEA